MLHLVSFQNDFKFFLPEALAQKEWAAAMLR